MMIGSIQMRLFLSKIFTGDGCVLHGDVGDDGRRRQSQRFQDGGFRVGHAGPVFQDDGS